MDERGLLQARVMLIADSTMDIDLETRKTLRGIAVCTGGSDGWNGVVNYESGHGLDRWMGM